nr:MAG TPA: hypothetical protein [Caudoviricetes sp.]DAM43002.1 MAG TPA: hypothetical protein [Caudoviricetes sp.]DAP14776.1 MAG TPA: hypothetical protein [Caudoviricetes sp.]DAU69863.1 MAG TPA: hypothetical protein [Bacteriophage sp.]
MFLIIDDASYLYEDQTISYTKRYPHFSSHLTLHNSRYTCYKARLGIVFPS